MKLTAKDVWAARIVTTILLTVTAAYFVINLRTALPWVGKTFPGFLTFKNSVVGGFNQTHWPSARAGINYHDILLSTGGVETPAGAKLYEHVGANDPGHIFTYDFLRKPGAGSVTIPSIRFGLRELISIGILPLASGLIFFLMGIAIFYFNPTGSGRWPFLFFHFLVGNYLIGSIDFHLKYSFSYLHLAVFATIPAIMLHFALSFPEKRASIERRPLLLLIPYIISAAVAIPYILLFEKNPARWINYEYAAVTYTAAAYIFWLATLFVTLKHPQFEINRIVAKYLLIGQITSFSFPLFAAIAIFAVGIQIPLNFITPLLLLFPLAVFMGAMMANLKQTQVRLVQTEKMASLGSLLAGVAHEINNPMTFVYTNVAPLKEYLEYFKKLILKLKEKTPLSPSELSEIERYKGDSGLDYVLTDSEELVKNLEEGATRAKEIVESLRHFSYKTSGGNDPLNVGEMLDRTIALLTPKTKGRIDVRKEYGVVPTIRGNAGEINQVFMNILSNASDAIKDRGEIRIATREAKFHVEISIKDNGVGIPKKNLSKIFDPFFTTKRQGEGTGLGLSICQEIIRKHNGEILVKSEEGKGTEFVIRLPV